MATMNLNIIRDKNVGERCFPWLWFVRIAQLLLSIIILGIAASNVSAVTLHQHTSLEASLTPMEPIGRGLLWHQLQRTSQAGL